jgi:hypothetical protein
MKHCFGLIMLGGIVVLLAGCGQSSIQPTTTSIPQPMATPMTGWHYVIGKGVAISLPDAFVGGDLSESNRKDISERLKPENKTAVGLLKAFEQIPNDSILLFALDIESSDSDSLSTLSITSDTVSEALHPLTHLESRTRQYPAFPFKVKSKEEFKADGNLAGRMIIEWGEKGAREVLYAIRYKTRMYVIDFSISHDEFENMLPIIEQSIQTFTVEP